jgi:ParB family chromosome partitioning protein
MAKQRARVTDDTTENIIRASILDQILNMPDLDQVPMLMVPIDLIDPNPYQTRRHFDPEKLEELASAMRANGFLGSLVARQIEGRYQLAYGERRLRAARLAQIAQIPLNVAEFRDVQMMEVAVTENVNREDLTPVEEAEAYQLLSEAGYSYRKISERVGKSVGHISKSLALLKLGDVKEAVEHPYPRSMTRLRTSWQPSGS